MNIFAHDTSCIPLTVPGRSSLGIVSDTAMFVLKRDVKLQLTN